MTFGTLTLPRAAAASVPLDFFTDGAPETPYPVDTMTVTIQLFPPGEPVKVLSTTQDPDRSNRKIVATVATDFPTHKTYPAEIVFETGGVVVDRLKGKVEVEGAV